MNRKDDLAREISPGKYQPGELFTSDPTVVALIAEQAAEWFVANREGLDSTQSAEFAAWLRTSPLHIEEYLNITMLGRHLRAASHEPELSLEDLLKRALETQDPVSTITQRPEPPQSHPSKPGLTEWLRWRPQPWLPVAAAVAVIGIVALAFVFWKNSATPIAGYAIAYTIQTRHGQLLTRELPDHSVLKLDTDTSVSVRFDRMQRLVRVLQGRAEFKVAHEPTRKFLVQAGTVGITDVGTEFDVYARPDSTVVTVLEGRVAVAVDPKLASSVSGQGSAPPSVYAPVEVAAGQQVRVDNGSWPPTYTRVATQHDTAWLHGQIVFENEPLERVAAEFNRYAPTPIEIDTPTLRTLKVSGVFAADDSESFIAFLRSLDDVQVEVTPARIRVSRK